MAALATHRLPLLRHLATDHLARYLRAVDEHDLDGVLAQLGGARVDLGGQLLADDGAIAAAYQRAFTNGGRTRHLIFPLEGPVAGPSTPPAASGEVVHVHAPYQRWSLDHDPPALSALGRYSADYEVHPQHLRLVQLRVVRDWQATSSSPSRPGSHSAPPNEGTPT